MADGGGEVEECTVNSTDCCSFKNTEEWDITSSSVYYLGQEFINRTHLQHYQCSDKGLLLPLFSEYTWSVNTRATLYCLGLLYCFLGVAIIADIFMGAIEKITSKTRKIYMTSAKEDEPDFIEVRVWSDTVANLTLMALGSSAPEILLSIIEIFANKFEAGALGPSTIVGSAAFNLLVICAVCVIAIPEGEVRRIKDIKVFAVTSTFSVLAYVWLLIILMASSEGVVDLWEALITLLMFPALVLVAWLAERNFCGPPNDVDENKQIELGAFQPGESDKLVKEREYFRDGKLDRDGLVQFIKEVKKYPGLSDEDAAVLAASKLVESQSHSRMWYRVGAVRNMTGGRKTQPQLSVKLKEVYNAMNEHPDAPTLGEVPKIKEYENAIVDFHAASCAVMEDIGKFKVSLIRSGRTDTKVTVRVESIDGTATVDQDYIGINEKITFEAGETEKHVEVEIINDNQWEPDEEFFLKIGLLMNAEDRKGIQLGRISIMEITILNDDEPGVISFQRRGFLVKESIGKSVLPVVRRNGADGEVSVKWRTIDKTAVSGKDFEGGEGLLVFKHTEVELNIEIPIMDDMTPEKDEHFEIELFDCTGGAKLGSVNRTAVTITNDDDFNNVLSRMLTLTEDNLEAMQIHHNTYLSQIKDALNVNGGDIENASAADYVLHFCTFGWKLLFSLVPPPSIAGGWLTFFVAITMIGVLTAIISDLASIFGCLVDLKDPVTAITFVALGTSLPDTFASKAAAVGEKHADTAIGNVTGSNAVNVFLGLGIPWTIATIYHAVNKTTFKVTAGSLGFSVGLFTGLSIICLATLLLRRYVPLFGGELGGPKGPKMATGVFFVSLWIIYVLLSSFQAYNYF